MSDNRFLMIHYLGGGDISSIGSNC